MIINSQKLLLVTVVGCEERLCFKKVVCRIAARLLNKLQHQNYRLFRNAFLPT